MTTEEKVVLKRVVDWFEEDPTRWNMGVVWRTKSGTDPDIVPTLYDMEQACIIGAICLSDFLHSPMGEDKLRYSITDILGAAAPSHCHGSVVAFGEEYGLVGFIELANKVMNEVMEETNGC